nr:hypothetical protein [uncultured Dubosiella sp.]
MTSAFFVVLLYQSVVQSAFFALYYPSPEKRRLFLFYLGFFMLVLYPLDTLFPATWPLLKNIFNFGLVLTEIVSVFAFYVFTGHSPDPTRFNVDQSFMYALGSFALTIVYLVMLQVFPNGLVTRKKGFLYLLGMLLNVGFTALCGAFIVVPDEHVFFARSYGIALAFLFVFNGATFVSLRRFIRIQKAQSAQRALESVYQKQLACYVRDKSDEHVLRRLRHDLLNFWETTKEES